MMSMPALSETDYEGVLSAKTRELSERGYTIYRSANDILPKELRTLRPDAIAVGKEPNYLIEVIRDDVEESAKLKQLRQEISKIPGWKLLVLYDRGTRVKALAEASAGEIDAAIESARNVLAAGEVAPALLLAWGVFEALARRLRPEEFHPPQSPGRVIQILTAAGELSSQDEMFLRHLVPARNSIIHGELATAISAAEVREFIGILGVLRRRLNQAETVSS